MRLWNPYSTVTGTCIHTDHLVERSSSTHYMATHDLRVYIMLSLSSSRGVSWLHFDGSGLIEYLFDYHAMHNLEKRKVII